MPKKILTFDIETVPQQNLSSIQQEELERKLTSYLSRNSGADPDEAKSLLMGTSPYFGKIVTLGLHLATDAYDDGKGTAIIGDEKEILEKFWQLLAEDSYLFVSYNGLSFDVPFILARSMHHKLKPTSKAFCNTRRFIRDPHFDAKEIISCWDRYAAPTLHLATDLVGIQTPKDGEVKADKVNDAFLAGDIDKIAAYCVKDVKATYELYRVLKDY